MKYKIISSRLLVAAIYALMVSDAAFAEDLPTGLDSAATLVMDYRTFEARVLKSHPILHEKSLDVEKRKLEQAELKASVILPRFEIDMGMGPAPGLNRYTDTTGYVVINGENFPILSEDREYDFSTWGPYFGVDAKVAQPLNIGRYRSARNALNFQVAVEEAQARKRRVAISFEAQELYFKRLYAQTMLTILNKAAKDLDDAGEKIDEMLDEGDPSVSQTDMLELKAGRYALEKGRLEAEMGLRRSALQMGFMLQVPQAIQIEGPDKQLFLRTDPLPDLDSLKTALLIHHPDLQRLENGLEARRELVRVAKGELGPDFFLFGNFRYSKAWSSDRETVGSDPFIRDPLNELTGVAGIGMKFRLNVWQRYQKFRREKIELEQLRRTEVYAAQGLLLQLEDAHLRYLNAQARVQESATSLRAAEAWLKGAAMTYDLDPSTAKAMLSPYKTVLNAKKDYFEAVLDQNVALARVFEAVGWTLSDYFDNLSESSGAQPMPQ